MIPPQDLNETLIPVSNPDLRESAFQLYGIAPNHEHLIYLKINPPQIFFKRQLYAMFMGAFLKGRNGDFTAAMGNYVCALQSATSVIRSKKEVLSVIAKRIDSKPSLDRVALGGEGEEICLFKEEDLKTPRDW